jgi:hypothetical protein
VLSSSSPIIVVVALSGYHGIADLGGSVLEGSSGSFAHRRGLEVRPFGLGSPKPPAVIRQRPLPPNSVLSEEICERPIKCTGRMTTKPPRAGSDRERDDAACVKPGAHFDEASVSEPRSDGNESAGVPLGRRVPSQRAVQYGLRFCAQRVQGHDEGDPDVGHERQHPMCDTNAKATRHPVVWTNSLHLHPDRVVVKTSDHLSGRWLDDVEWTVLPRACTR